ncbi:MAG TPA: alpha/beta hydrolase [Acidimicrobiales bacterium]|nr:alpha/beta hydrolase [Acidimicrobiales bacterium]
MTSRGFVDQLHLGRIVLVGQSLGALVAIRYAARYPERVAALVAVDAGPYVAWSSGIEKIASFSLDRDHFESLEDAVEYALAFNPRRDRRLLRHSVTHALRPLPEGGWAWKRDLRNRSRGRLAAMVDQVADLVPEAATITCPTLVANGAESDVYGSDEAARFADLVIDGRWASIEGAGHNIQGDNPAGLLGVVRPFLAARNEALLEYLTELGAGGIEHPGGTLLEHLQRVAALLADWGARAELVSAGLLHAVYGTDGLPTRLRTLDQRPQVADRIGSEAEAIVYRYASCDRAFFFSGTREGDRRRFRDRFEDHVSLIAPKQLADFLELTFANELDLINTSPHFAAANGPAILSMFRPYADQVSQRARAAYVKAADLTTS